MIFVDSHCHLDMLIQYDSIDNIVNRASEIGVKYLQTICTKLDNFENILNIAKKYQNIFTSVGVHPSEIIDDIVLRDKLLSLAEDEKVISFGETGLDYFYNKESYHHKLQIESFEQHIKAAQDSSLPVIIHTRDAEKDTIDIINRNMKYKAFPGLIHCFTSDKEFAKSMLDLGMYISIAGVITFKNAEQLREALRFIPLDRILIETDSPYLSPVPKRGKTNEPSYIEHTAKFIAKQKKISLEELASQTTENFFTLFTKAKKLPISQL